jgi:predicted ribosome quality control (RQC) complex YloA/Tae2 family protein
MGQTQYLRALPPLYLQARGKYPNRNAKGIVITDWILTRRVAAELDRALRGGRVTGCGLLEDGRFAVRLDGLRGRPAETLAVDAFGTPPLATLTPLEISPAADPGWTRAIAAALRGMRVTTVRARRGDRVLVLSLATHSRFGVANELRLVLELIPRFGNVLLVRDRTVIGAAKQFSPAENEARSIQAGGTYIPPPLPAAVLDADGFREALGGDRRQRVRALGGYLPELPRLLAESLVVEAESAPWPSSAQLADWLQGRAAAILSSTAGEPDGLGDVHSYWDSERLVQVHVLPLAQFAGLRHERAPSVLPLLAQGRAAGDAARDSSKVERRRTAIAGRVAKRRAAIEVEQSAVHRKRDDAAGRDDLRAAGDALYTHAADVPPGAAAFVPPTRPELTIVLDPDLDAKANAAAYFARYRKAADALPHLERRLESLAARVASFEELAFEAERADAAALDDIAAALEELDGKRPAPAPLRGKQRPPLRIERPSGARIYVGRSPRENVEVTFRIARPDDLWFHARNVPGSHVVLQAPPGAPAAEEDLSFAADLAATHSRARAAPRVDIDYTERKFVRKQRDGAPGLVWYTGARTRIGRPES